MHGPGCWSPFVRMLASIMAIALCLPACRITDLTLWQPTEPVSAADCEVELIRDVPYCTDAVRDVGRRRLDLYLPKGRKDFPVVVFVHGGTWMAGDNRCCGLYSSVGEFLARHGIGAALPNYRLSPRVRHPKHIKDVARAVAWVHRNIAAYGGRPDQLFLAGHSAGGHLVALLATDGSYLEAEGLRLSDIKGTIAVSGVYDIPPRSMALTLGGETSRALRIEQLVPLRATKRQFKPPAPVGIPIRLDPFLLAFGSDEKVRNAASPLQHVRPGLAPFLLCYAENDLPTLADMAERFHGALVEQGCESRLFCIGQRNHHSIIFSAIELHDPLGRAMVEFVHRHKGL